MDTVKMLRKRENIRKSQPEVITALKITQEKFKSRMAKLEAQIKELEDKAIKITRLKVKQIIQRSEDTLRHFLGNIKWSNICIMGIQEEEER